MIITRTPFRISFFGGGTDYPIWYKENRGVVLSATINKYCYISCRYLPPFFDHNYQIRYTAREETRRVSEIKHPAVRETIKFLNIKKGVEMVHTSDLPARSGIASSSCFTVGFLNALYALKGKIVTKRQLAKDAIHIEQNILKENVGSQDQIAVTFGGFNKIVFGGEEEFFVHPITINQEKINYLQDCFMLFFTGISRCASNIAAEQIKRTRQKARELTDMMQMVDEATSILNATKNGINNFGRLLHEAWKIKRSLTPFITTNKIDEIYNAAMSAGALGGKLLGAGGGGFILFFALPKHHPAIKKKLKKLLYVPFRFETLGSHVVLYSTQDFIKK